MQRNYEKIAYLKEEIESIQGGFSPELLKTIMSSVKGNSIETYVKEYRNKDLVLLEEINKNYSDMEYKKEITDYFHARIDSLGQLSYKGASYNTRTLRDFVMDTDFKDQDDTQAKNFLLLVARAEEQYCQQQYGPLIEEYEKNLSLKEKLRRGIVIGTKPQENRRTESVSLEGKLNDRERFA